jgi:hypothetical protein
LGQGGFRLPLLRGYEFGDGPIGVLNPSPMSIHHALMLPDWGKTVFFLKGRDEPSADEFRQLEQRGTQLERVPITHIDGDRADVHLADGRVASVAGMSTTTRTCRSSNIAQQLGCKMDESPSGAFIRIDPRKATTVSA